MESFFYECSQVIDNHIEILDALLHRYSNIEYIMNMDTTLGLKMITKCFEKENESMLWDLYVARSIVATEKMPSFQEWLDKSRTNSKNVTNNNASTITFIEIEKYTDDIAKRAKERR